MTTASPPPEVHQPDSMPLAFRDAMRQIAASVMLVTSRDADGEPHGMVASSVIPVSMDPPSMLVAVNRSAGLHPVLRRTLCFCVNVLGDHQHALLAPFSQSALREQRFTGDGWNDVRAAEAERLPWLASAPAVIDCAVEAEVDYGTHTIFVGRVTKVRCESGSVNDSPPLVWLAGQRAGLLSTT